MPYMALQCFSCQHMQVKEVRKTSSSSRKWSCAICNEKQSVRKVFSSAETAKEVRKFVQNFNLTAGQAAQAEAISRLEVGSPTEDLSYDYRYLKDEEGQMNGTTGKHDYAGEKKKSFKWDKYLPDEEQGCSEDELQQSSDDMRFTTTFPEPTSRRRTRPRSSSPPAKRPLRGLTTSTDNADAEPESFVPNDSKKTFNTSRSDNSLKFQQSNDSGLQSSIPLGKSSCKLATAPESKSSCLPTLDSDRSPRTGSSCHSQVAGAQTSKWSKYLT